MEVGVFRLYPVVFRGPFVRAPLSGGSIGHASPRTPRDRKDRVGGGGLRYPSPTSPWVTIVHNDPVNLMSYVTYVFQTYFGYTKDKATKLMLDVHHKGRAVVSSGTREEMERDVQAMHGYGLWATLQQDRK